MRAVAPLSLCRQRRAAGRSLAIRHSRQQRFHACLPASLPHQGRYFFGLLERMQGDVGRQPDTPQKAALVQRLAAIKKVADAAAE